MNKKKRVVIHSNFSKLFTGFARHKKNILRYLVKTGKYDIIELANSKAWDDPSFIHLPWECYGTLPSDPIKIGQIKENKSLIRLANYGHFEIDEIIKKLKPDVYLGAEDIWAFDGYSDKPWWNKIHTAIWTTIDSTPISKESLEFAAKTKNFFVWASFAEKEMKEKGLDHVKTINGIIDNENLYRIKDESRDKLRASIGLDEDHFVIGFVFRNQLRKGVANLLEGFKLFKDENPNVKAKLLLHTSWQEGWDIESQAERFGVDMSDILTTYRCKTCGKVTIKSYEGEGRNCGQCGCKGSVGTTNTSNGISQKELNMVYNIMDVYCHPFTSGGQEMPIQEAKLCELITLVTSYSCGEDYCDERTGGLALDWDGYLEHQTEFLKANTKPESIKDQLSNVFKMTESERRDMGKIAREYVFNNMSIEAIGKQIEDWLDSLEDIEYDFNWENRVRLEEFVDDMPDEEDDLLWLQNAYRKVLDMEVSKFTTDCDDVLESLESGAITRESVIRDLLELGKSFNDTDKRTITIKDVLGDEDKSERLAIVMPETAGDVYMVSSLLRGFKETYPNHKIYFFTKASNFELLDESPYIHKLVDYSQNIDNNFYLEGRADVDGYFDLSFHPHWFTQKLAHYTHAERDKIQLNLKYED